MFCVCVCVRVSQPVVYLHETVVAHGMSVAQLKQALLSELAEKRAVSRLPLDWCVRAL